MQREDFINFPRKAFLLNFGVSRQHLPPCTKAASAGFSLILPCRHRPSRKRKEMDDADYEQESESEYSDSDMSDSEPRARANKRSQASKAAAAAAATRRRQQQQQQQQHAHPQVSNAAHRNLTVEEEYARHAKNLQV